MVLSLGNSPRKESTDTYLFLYNIFRLGEVFFRCQKGMIQADPRRFPPCLSFIDFRSSVQPSTYFLQTLLNRLSRIISSTLRLKIVLVCRTTEGSVSHSPSRIAKYTHYFFVSLFQHLCVQSGGNKVSLARSPVNNGESTIDYCINRLVETYIITRLIESFSKICVYTYAEKFQRKHVAERKRRMLSQK